MNLFEWLFGNRQRKRESGRIKIIDTEGLFYRDGAARGYNKLKRTYSRHQLSNYINGRKVKVWKIVYGADDADGDKFIPIFYRSRSKRHRRK